MEAFPTATVSDYADGTYSGASGSFTGLTFDEFEVGVASVFGAQVENVSLTYELERYAFTATGLDLTMNGNNGYNGAGDGGPIEFNSFTLTFPKNVVSTNGEADGRTVTWDFVIDPSMTEIHASTAKPKFALTGAFTKVGTAKVGKTVKIKAPKADVAGVTKSYAWYAGTKKIKGATKAKLRIAKSLAGAKLSVKVTYAKADYDKITKTIKFGKVAK